MKSSYPCRFGLLEGALSAFDIGATIQKHTDPLTRGLDFDMQQLSNDQNALTTDYQKASDRLTQDIFGDRFES